MRRWDTECLCGAPEDSFLEVDARIALTLYRLFVII
jgi:hypothetical protein